MTQQNVIAAISTAISPSGIGIVRMSGKGCIEIANRIFSGRQSLIDTPSHQLVYGHIMDGDRILDEVLVGIMRAPKSYTTEDVVEINCHGGILIERRILSLLYEHGAVPAAPGEFTMRAFMGGRIDLSQAESVMDMIAAENDASLRNSMQQLSGSFSRIIEDIREMLLHEIAFIEAALDDPEHYSLEGYGQRLKGVLLPIRTRLEGFIAHAADGLLRKNGISTALIGRVNVGKSSLLNALAGQDKAIVTDIPGTTRDALEESVRLGELTLRIMDTAGIRQADDPIERIGIERSLQRMEDADLVLFVLDASHPLQKEDEEFLEKLSDKQAIVLLNKTDLPMQISKEELRTRTKQRIVEISAKELRGIDELQHAVEEMFFGGDLQVREEFYVTNERHQHLIKNAYESIVQAEKSLEQGVPEDFLTIDLTDAYESLGKILGREVNDDIISEIFSTFCMGK